MIDMSHMDYLQEVVDADLFHLRKKEETYGGSWKKRGGIGAFMMLARKWDRLDNILGSEFGAIGPGGTSGRYDIFRAIEIDMSGADGTVLAEVRDLRRYLTLVEAEMLAKQDRARRKFGGRTLYGDKGPIEVSVGEKTLPEVLRDASEPLRKWVDERLVPRYEEPIIPQGETNDQSSLVGRKIRWGHDNDKTYTGVVTADVKSLPYIYAQEAGGVTANDPLHRWRVMRDVILEIEPAPVPAEDSNRHAERATHLHYNPIIRRAGTDERAFRYNSITGAREPRPLISSEVYHRLSDDAKKYFVLIGASAIEDRSLWPQERKEVSSRYSLTMTKLTLDGMPLWIHDMYEPRTGVEGEVQMKEPYRELWGR